MDKGKRVVFDEEDEEEPLQLVGTDVPNDDTASLYLIGKLWTSRAYNSFGMVETMKKLWNPSRGLTCRDLGSKLMSFQFNSSRDLKRVMDMEPWHFNKHVLVLKQRTDEIQPSAMKFNTIPFWIRIYDLPKIRRTELTLRQIGSRFGEVLEVDSSTLSGITRSVRVKVMINLEKPIKRGTKIQIGKADPCWLPAAYERLPSFCYWCGLLGHTHKDCLKYQDMEDEGNVVPEAELPYGESLRASPWKKDMIMSENGAVNREALRKSLFSKPIPIRSETRPMKETKMGTEAEKNATASELSELLNVFEKVEVSGNKKTEKTKMLRIEEKNEMSTKVESNTNKLPAQKGFNYASSNVLHPTTKTISHSSNTKHSSHNTQQNTPPQATQTSHCPHTQQTIQANHYSYKKNQPREPIPSHIPITLTPLADLVKMVQQQTQNKPPAVKTESNTPHPSATLIPGDKTSLLKPKSEKRNTHINQSTTKPPKTWKRHQTQGQRNQQEGELKAGKRKEGDIGAEKGEEGESKKPRSEEEEIQTVTAKAAAQPRRTL